MSESNKETEQPHTTHTNSHTATHTAAQSPAAKSNDKTMLYVCGAIIVILVIAVVVLATGVLKPSTPKNQSSTIPYSQIGSLGNSSKTPNGAPHINGTQFALKPNSPAALAFVKQVSNYTVTQNQITANYSGTITSSIAEYVANQQGSVQTYIVQPSTMTRNVVSSYEKYGPAARSYTVISSNASAAINSSLGSQNATASTYYLKNGTFYTCFSSPAENCTAGNRGFGYSSTDPLSFLSNYTLSNLTTQSSMYNGMNCTKVSGAMNLTSINTQVFSYSLGNFTSCIYEPYNLALYSNITVGTRAAAYYGSNGTTENVNAQFMIHLKLSRLANNASLSFVTPPANQVVISG